MSRIHPPKDAHLLDQTKAFHVVTTEGSYTHGILCGELEQTGEMHSYSYFSVPGLRCKKCGEVIDASNYDRLVVGSECTIADVLEVD